MHKGKVAVAAAVAVSLLAAGGYAAVRGLDRPKADAWLTEEVRFGDVEDAVVTWGTLQPFETVEVGTLVGGQLISVDVGVGDWVKQGQVVAQIEAQRLQNELRNSESRLSAERQNVARFTSNLENAKAGLARQEKLKAGGFGSQEKHDQAANQVRMASANLDQFEHQLKTVEIQIEGAKQGLEKATIRAPLDGMVVEIVSRPGQMLNPFQSAPVILKIARMEVMTVRVQVSEADVIKVRPGQKTWFTVLGFPETRYHATLRTREPAAAGGGGLDASGPKALNADQGVYYNALFEVPNPKGELLPAMTAEVRIVLGEATHVLTVPRTALGPAGPDGLRPVKVLLADGTLAERRVRLGLANATLAEVRSGLKAGDRVVIGGTARAKT